MLKADTPALVLAPMDGITDAPMRSLQGACGAFTFAVTEFLRVTQLPIPRKVFERHVPELRHGARTLTGLPVQVQLLGGEPEAMAKSAATACRAGANGIDINFGCPAPTVNRHDGGATLLKHPQRIRAVVSAVRAAVPAEIPVSAKLRLGWDCIDEVYENAAMAAEGGASWLTIHARTRTQGYTPPVYWKPLGEVRAALDIPLVANGDIWTLDDFHRCQEQTGCIHFMLGRGALANPALPLQVARALGLPCPGHDPGWGHLLHGLIEHSLAHGGYSESRRLKRLKQWLKLASRFGEFHHFEAVKRVETEAEFFSALALVCA
ncbi:MAG: tRNA dihydrouridine synthase [Vulcanimicrobiota bacterium]